MIDHKINNSPSISTDNVIAPTEATATVPAVKIKALTPHGYPALIKISSCVIALFFLVSMVHYAITVAPEVRHIVLSQKKIYQYVHEDNATQALQECNKLVAQFPKNMHVKLLRLHIYFKLIPTDHDYFYIGLYSLKDMVLSRDHVKIMRDLLPNKDFQNIFNFLLSYDSESRSYTVDLKKYQELKDMWPDVII